MMPPSAGEMTRGAVMMFQGNNGLAPDGDAGAATWKALLGAAITGRTALHGAGHKGRTAVIQLLVDAGAKLDARNKFGWTPLTIATGVYFNCRVVMNKHTAKLLQDLMAARGLDTSQAGVNTNGQRPDQSGAVQCTTVVDDLVDAQNPSEVQQRLLGEQMKREEALKQLQNQAK